MICKCGIAFEPKNHRQKYHSVECQLAHRKQKKRDLYGESDPYFESMDPHRLLSAKWDRGLSL